MALAVAACGDDEESKPEVATSNDLETVNFLLTLEYLEQDLYRDILAARVVTGRDGELVRRLERNESAHVRALEAAVRNLDGSPAARPETDFGGDLRGRAQALRTAAKIEGIGAAGYLGVLFAIESKEVLATVLSIHSVEGRHAAGLNRRVGRPFSPKGAFAEPLAKSEVMQAIEPYIG